jgi:hypothetical protein
LGGLNPCCALLICDIKGDDEPMTDRTEPDDCPEELIPTRKSLLGRLKDWQDNESWQDFFDTYWKLIIGTRRGNFTRRAIHRGAVSTRSNNSHTCKRHPGDRFGGRAGFR